MDREFIESFTNTIEELYQLKSVSSIAGIYIILCYRIDYDRIDYIDYIARELKKTTSSKIPNGLSSRTGLPDTLLTKLGFRKHGARRIYKLIPVVWPNRELVIEILEKKHGIKGELGELIARVSANTPAITDIIASIVKLWFYAY